MTCVDLGTLAYCSLSAALHHPDKVGASGTEGSSEMYFLHLKIAQDTLLDPARRYAYDHFGRDMLHWQNCTTISDYLKTASKQYTAQYLGSVGIIFVLDLLGFVSDGKFVCQSTSWILSIMLMIVVASCCNHYHGYS